MAHSPFSLARAVRALLLLMAALGQTSCGGVDGALSQVESHYEQARYEDAMTWLVAVEPDIHARDNVTRARFHYLRGMTAFRLDQKIQAKYHLALAKEIAGENRGRVLGVSWSQRLDRTLQILQLEGAGSSDDL